MAEVRRILSINVLATSDGELVCECEGGLPRFIDPDDVAMLLHGMAEAIILQGKEPVPLHRDS